MAGHCTCDYGGFVSHAAANLLVYILTMSFSGGRCVLSTNVGDYIVRVCVFRIVYVVLISFLIDKRCRLITRR